MSTEGTLDLSKEHVLREIRRTAEANGGLPLGRDKFSRATGIRPHEWGKFWARWSDAIRESGLEPNTLQTAFDEEMLLQKYADFIRELGHIPTSTEMRLKTHQDPRFPGRVIEARFARKHKLLTKTANYLTRRGDFRDVLEICGAYIPPKEVSASNGAEAFANEIGYVYLAKSGRFFKIGRTNAAGRREYEIGIQLPEEFAMVHLIPTDDPVGIEAYWHARFADKRKKGEWFQLTAADVSAFKRRQFM